MNRLRQLPVWLNRHSGSIRALTGALAAIVLVGGVVLGARGRSIPPRNDTAAAFRPETVAIEHVSPSRHSLVGVVRAVGPGIITVRSRSNVFFTVRGTATTRVRMDGKDVPATSLRLGDRVIVVGQPSGDGSLQASAITIMSRGPTPTSVAAPAMHAPRSSPTVRATATTTE